MIALRNRKKLVCRELVELVTDYLDGNLSRRDRARFDAHIAGCTNCTRYLEQFRETIRLTGALRESDVSPEAEAELLAQFAAWKRGEL
jgi:anti-sigma factor RsiW